MILYDQENIVHALLQPESYPAAWHVSSVELLQSHIALLFLAGDYVLKLKRAVLLPNVDFSTPQKRRVACVREMRRSTVYAPHLIIGIRSVRQLPDGQIVLGGQVGVEIDSVLVMRRLQKSEILGVNLSETDFDRFEVMDLAEQLADLHCKAKTFRTKWSYIDIQNVIKGIAVSLSDFTTFIPPKRLQELTQKSLQFLKRQAPLIALRQKGGYVRKCHGELLLSNIARDNGKYLFFSPIEYNESLDCIDTLYDLASLLMDFERRGLRRLANILFNHYLAYTNDTSGYPLLPLYQSMRAASRAVMCARKSLLVADKEKEEAQKSAQRYFNLAVHFLGLNKPALIACGGFSGSGKSRVARELGGLLNPAPGAVILRDDVVKKQMAGCPLNEKLSKSYQTPAFEQVVYDVLRQQAQTALSVGSVVIIDALFHNEKERKKVESLAQKMSVPFVGLWIEAPLDVRLSRVKTRKRNPSDIRSGEQLEEQLSAHIGVIDWHCINTNRERNDTISAAVKILAQAGIDVIERKE